MMALYSAYALNRNRSASAPETIVELVAANANAYTNRACVRAASPFSEEEFVARTVNASPDAANALAPAKPLPSPYANPYPTR